MAAERRGNVSPHCCGCSTRVMHENLPPDHTAVRPATTTAASTVRSAPAGSAREEEVDQSRATSDGGGADDGRATSSKAPDTEGSGASVSGQVGTNPLQAREKGDPRHDPRGHRTVSDTTLWLWRWSSSRVLSALSDSIPCRDYSMGRLVPLAGKGVTPNTINPCRGHRYGGFRSKRHLRAGGDYDPYGNWAAALRRGGNTVDQRCWSH